MYINASFVVKKVIIQNIEHCGVQITNMLHSTSIENYHQQQNLSYCHCIVKKITLHCRFRRLTQPDGQATVTNKKPHCKFKLNLEKQLTSYDHSKLILTGKTLMEFYSCHTCKYENEINFKSGE